MAKKTNPKSEALAPSLHSKSKSIKKGTPIVEQIAAATKIVGTLERPQARRYGDYGITIAVDKSRAKDINNVANMTSQSDPLVVAVLMEVGSTTEAALWEKLSLDKPELGNAESVNECGIPRLMDITGFTKTHLGILRKKGIVVRLARGRYDLDASMRNIFIEKDRQASGRGGQEYSEERTKDKREQRLMRELDRLQKAEQLVDADESRNIGFQMGLKFRKALENLEPRVSPELVAAKTRSKVRSILKQEINQILTSLALYQAPKPKRKKSAGSSRKRK